MSTDKRKRVLYIPGFLSGSDPQKEAKALLRRIYSPRQYKVESMPWEHSSTKLPDYIQTCCQMSWQSYEQSCESLFEASFFRPKNAFKSLIYRPSKSILTKWYEAHKKARNVARDLAKSIASMPKYKRENMVLIGHSLGAYIVVKTLASLAGRHMKISNAVLLGAAVDNNEPSLSAARRATIGSIDFTVNSLDWALWLYPFVSYHTALGFSGDSGVKSGKMRTIPATAFDHCSQHYIRQLAKFRNKPISSSSQKSSRPSSSTSIIPYSWLIVDGKLKDGKLL